MACSIRLITLRWTPFYWVHLRHSSFTGKILAPSPCLSFIQVENRRAQVCSNFKWYAYGLGNCSLQQRMAQLHHLVFNNRKMLYQKFNVIAFGNTFGLCCCSASLALPVCLPFYLYSWNVPTDGEPFVRSSRKWSIFLPSRDAFLRAESSEFFGTSRPVSVLKIKNDQQIANQKSII